MGEPRVTVVPALVGDDDEVLSSLINRAYPEMSEVQDFKKHLGRGASHD